jgi:triosephosphate isomerase
VASPGGRPLIAGNWKLYGTIAGGVALAEAVRQLVTAAGAPLDPSGTPARDVVLCPPFTAIAAVARAVAGSGIAVGGQDCFWERKGAFTGEVSAEMLHEAGATHVIVGHSERRELFGETDETVARKAAAAAEAKVVPIVCVGERLDDRDAGRAQQVVTRQVTAALLGFPEAAIAAGRLVLAYEPVWAIGTGRTATPEQAQQVHALVRRLLGERFGPVAGTVRILYGGSVKPENIDALMAEPDIDGALVGGASLDPAAFARIVGYKETPR